MRTLLMSLLFLATALSAMFSAESVAGPIVVIVNSANQQELSKQDIKNMYSDIVTHWKNGKRIHLYNLPAADEARDTFSQAVFGQTTREILQEEHNRKITNSIKNPSRTKRASLVSAVVRRDKDAIGYLPKEMLKNDKNIRIVFELD
jgi:ABC-type phosphate transport system substrate-binding protein